MSLKEVFKNSTAAQCVAHLEMLATRHHLQGYGWDALYLHNWAMTAARTAPPQALDWCVSRAKQPEKILKDALHEAAAVGRVDMVLHIMHQPGLFTSFDCHRCVELAAAQENLPLIDAVLKEGGNAPNERVVAAVQLAKRGKVCYQRYTEPNQGFAQIVCAAAEGNHAAIVEDLLFSSSYATARLLPSDWEECVRQAALRARPASLIVLLTDAAMARFGFVKGHVYENTLAHWMNKMVIGSHNETDKCVCLETLATHLPFHRWAQLSPNPRKEVLEVVPQVYASVQKKALLDEVENAPTRAGVSRKM